MSGAVIISVGGRSGTTAEWAGWTGLSNRVIRYRLSKGWDAERAVTTPAMSEIIVSVGGRTGTITDWAKWTGLNRATLTTRLVRYGWTPERAVTTPASYVRAGLAGHPLAGIWRGMLDRCHNPKDPNYGRYGGRGIVVCPAWRASFWAFVEDIEETIGPRPSLRHTIDRIDNDGGYEPGNVRWATPVQQQRNTRRNRVVCIGGERRPLAEWAELTGIPWSTLAGRLDRGWTPEAAIATPAHSRAASHTFIPPGGEAQCRALGFNPSTIYERMRRRGISFEQAISEPLASNGKPGMPVPLSPHPSSSGPPAPAGPLTLFDLPAAPPPPAPTGWRTP